ncbi:O-antigen polysaccharide polymerase Wzy [Micromonospora okii]|uniref:O-antigen polysaccharide polymerase Wzy n=1 Tax=Micromonospora okii TaxID=1182970 RepID=UPI001E3325EA|nr:O-antigen polysaccharide polymerase Wzy [Micromonospora okii]
MPSTALNEPPTAREDARRGRRRAERTVDILGRRPGPVALAVVGAVQVALVVSFWQPLTASTRVAATAAAVVACTTLALLLRLRGNRQFSLGVVLLASYAVFHLGVSPYLVRGALPGLLAAPDGDPVGWLLSPEIATATTLTTLSMAVFLLGYALAALAQRRRRSRTEPVEPAGDTAGATTAMLWLGPVLACGGTLLLLSVVQAEGWDSLGAANYALYRTEEHRAQLGYAFLLLGVGLAVLGTNGRRGRSHLWALALAPFVVIPLAIGWRGGTIFPIAAYLVGWSRSHRMRVRPWHAVALLALLTLGSIVRQARERGPKDFRLTEVSVNPMDGLAELGATLRTVVVVREWHGLRGEPFTGWATYWAPVERLLDRLLGLPFTPAALDERNLSTVFLSRTGIGAIGGSPTAEAYRAAGVLGIVVVFMLIGALVAYLDSRPSGTLSEYAVALVGYVLLVWSRNNFTPVVAQLALCLGVLALAGAWETLRARAAAAGPPRLVAGPPRLVAGPPRLVAGPARLVTVPTRQAAAGP